MSLYKEIIGRFKPSEIFSVDDICQEPHNRASVVVQLSRLVSNGRLMKFRRGAYYVPEPRAFYGVPYPSKNDVVRFFCKYTDGYVSGEMAYNLMGLTEQVPNIIVIASNSFTPGILTYDGKQVKIKRAICSPNGKDKDALRILDALTDIREIPGKSVSESIDRLTVLMKSFDLVLLESIVDYSKYYPARTRHLLGMILNKGGFEDLSSIVVNTINPLTRKNYEYSKTVS